MPVAAGHAVIPLQVHRGQQLARHHLLFDARCILGDFIQHQRGEMLPVAQPGHRAGPVPAPRRPIGRKLHNGRQYMTTRGCCRRIVDGGYTDIERRMGRVLAVLHRIKGALEVVHVRGDHQALAQPRAVEAGKARQAVQRQVQPGGDALAAYLAHPPRHTGFHMAKAYQAFKGCHRIGTGYHQRGPELFARCQGHARRPPVDTVDAAHPATQPQFDSADTGTGSHGLAQGAHAAFNLCHPVVTEILAQAAIEVAEHRAGGARPHAGTEYAVEAQHGFQLRAVEILLHQVVHIGQDDAHQIAHIVPPQQLQPQPQPQQGQPVRQVGLHQFGRARFEHPGQQPGVPAGAVMERAPGLPVVAGQLVALDQGT